MLFNSPEFLLGFLPVTLVAFFAAARLKRGRTLVLLVASWAFYAAWSVAYLPLLILSTAGNFLVGMQLIRRRSRLLLGIAVAANLLLLGWYKYTGFGVEALGDLLGRDLPALHVIEREPHAPRGRKLERERRVLRDRIR